MDIYSLYKKTHNETGLQYLGYTKQDPFKYKGSGKIWRAHIAKHGYDVTTEVLHRTTNKEEIRVKGSHYSELWNIVESKEWANLKPEEADGGQTSSTEELSERAKKLWASKKHKTKMQEIHSSDSFKNKMSKISKEWCNSPEGKKKKSEIRKKNLSDPEFVSKMNLVFKSAKYKKSLSISAKKRCEDPNEIKRLREKAISQRENDPVFYCERCGVSIKGHPGWGRHIRSKKHARYTCE